MRKALMSLAGLAIWTSPAIAQDNTPSCLEALDGPLIVIEGNQGYTDNNFPRLEDGARFDARTAIFMQQTNPLLDGKANPYPVIMRTTGDNRLCWSGGVVHNTNDPNLTWRQSYSYNHAGIITRDGGNVTVEGVRIHQSWDALKFVRYTDIVYRARGNWITRNRDDCVENDIGRKTGLLEDNLFDGCYVFFSSRAPLEKSGPLTVRNNLIRMQVLPGPNKRDRDEGYGALFKWSGTAGTVEIHDNIFFFDKGGNNNIPNWPVNDITGCSGNTIVWLNNYPYPGALPTTPGCVTITDDRSIWDEARYTWLRNHDVARIAGVDDGEPPYNPGTQPPSCPDCPPPTTSFEAEGTTDDGRRVIIEGIIAE